MMVSPAALCKLTLSSALLLGAASAMAGASLSVSTSITSHHVSDSFTVDIGISGASDVYAYQFDLSFDPLVLRADTSSEGSFLSTAGSTVFIAGSIDNATGVLSFLAGALTGSLPGASGEGTLAQVTFTARAKGTSDVLLGNVLLLDSAFEPLAAALGSPVNVVVNGATMLPVPEPTTLSLLALGLLAIALRGQVGKRRPNA